MWSFSGLLVTKTMLLITELPHKYYPTKLKSGSELVLNYPANAGTVYCKRGTASYMHVSIFILKSIGTETSVRNYHHSLRNNPQERSFHLLRA
jgi:hypothetical protein